MFAPPRNASKKVMKGVIQKVRSLGEGDHWKANKNE